MRHTVERPVGGASKEGVEVFDNYGWLAWTAIALALGAIEAATVDFVFLMLAGGALGGAGAAAFGAGFPFQVIAAVVVAGILLALVRPWAKSRFTVRKDGVKMGTAGYVGRSGFVLETITGSSGRVKLGGETWSAKTADGAEPQPGDEVRVVAIEGATAVVTRVQPPI